MSYIKEILKRILAALYSIAILCALHEQSLMCAKVESTSSIEEKEHIHTQGDNKDKNILDNQILPPQNNNNTIEDNQEEVEEQPIKHKTIRKIIIIGNTLIPTNALLVKIPYREGEEFNPVLTGQLIRNLYKLNYFDAIEVKADDISSDEVNIYVIVKEKKKLEEIQYEGNKSLKQEEIEKKLKLSEIPATSQEELELYAEKIKKLYAEKNYHSAEIVPQLCPTEHNTVIAKFNINEGNQAIVKRILFQGNKCFSGKKLRSIIYTHEDWLFWFTNKAGSYHPEILEADKHVIENFYQSNGFLAARVVNIKVDMDPVSQCIVLTYFIEEGDLFTIKSVSAPGNKLLTEPQLLTAIPIKPGQLYSKEAIRQTMELLRLTWGQFGYIDADIQPAIQPNFEEKTVEITFYSELGTPVFLNRINILGNRKTRDYVIRRNISLYEGELLTTQQMDISLKRIESLGFFDPQGGVEWKVNKVSEGIVDLDLLLKEIRTGKLYGQIGYGGADPKSPSKSLKVSAGIGDRNFLGTGIRYNVNVTYSKEDRGVLLDVFQPWLFDKPIGAGLNAYYRRATYEDLKNVQTIPVETVTGATGNVTISPQRYPDLAILFTGGVDNISYESPVRATSGGKTVQQQQLLQQMLERQFQPGKLSWIGLSTGQDLRNHPVFPSRGYNWNFSTKLCLPFPNSSFGFIKCEFDATWLTPLIGEYDLIFLLHGHAGFVKPLNNKIIPYRELYHVGGPATVRGFNFGQIGPQAFCDSIGGKKAFWVNAELIFSITKDQSIRGVVFYDGGAGWDTPNAAAFATLQLQNNRFNYRHAIGFGIRLTRPTPLRIDWAFKLDRNKRRGENISEVHFTMAQEF